MFALHLNEPMGVWIDITITKKTNTEKSMDVFQNKYWHKILTDFFFIIIEFRFAWHVCLIFHHKLLIVKFIKRWWKGFGSGGGFMNNLKWFGVHRTRLEWGPGSPFIVRSLEIPTDPNSTYRFCPYIFFHRTKLTLIPFHIASTRVLKCKLNSY